MYRRPRTITLVYSEPDRAYRDSRSVRDPDRASFGDSFTNAQWFWLATLVATGIVLVSVFGYAAIAHAIHPDCASVLACVRL